MIERVERSLVKNEAFIGAVEDEGRDVDFCVFLDVIGSEFAISRTPPSYSPRGITFQDASISLNLVILRLSNQCRKPFDQLCPLIYSSCLYQGKVMLGGIMDMGILPEQAIRALIEDGVITQNRSDEDSLPPLVQPASLDLQLGQTAYRMRASYLPGSDGRVEDTLDESFTRNFKPSRQSKCSRESEKFYGAIGCVYARYLRWSNAI